MKKVFNTMATIFNYVPEQTEALGRKLLKGMKERGVPSLNDIYDSLKPQEPARAVAYSNHSGAQYRK